MTSTVSLVPHGGFHLTWESASETVLLDAAKRGEEWAFFELCRRHSRRVYLTICRITPDRADAEDALQTALLNAFKNLHQFDARAQFSTWLTRIGINAAFMLLRKRRSYREVSMAMLDSEGDTPPAWQAEDYANDPQEQCLQQEAYDQLHAAIARLPEAYQAIMKVQVTGDMSMKELAEMFGLSIAATKSRILRAKKILRRNMARMQSKPAASRRGHPAQPWNGLRLVPQHVSSFGKSDNFPSTPDALAGCRGVVVAGQYRTANSRDPA